MAMQKARGVSSKHYMRRIQTCRAQLGWLVCVQHSAATARQAQQSPFTPVDVRRGCIACMTMTCRWKCMPCHSTRMRNMQMAHAVTVLSAHLPPCRWNANNMSGHASATTRHTRAHTHTPLFAIVHSWQTSSTNLKNCRTVTWISAAIVILGCWEEDHA